MKAFVTGGTGFIGSHLVESLIARGDEVRCLVREDEKWLAGLRYERFTGDLSDPDTLRAACDGVDIVYHTAGVTRARHEDAFTAGNVTGTLNVLDAVKEAAPGVQKVLVTSSLAVIGAAATVADESTPMKPVSRYGASKAEMERRLAPYHDDLPMVVVRPPAVYGPREKDILTFFQTVARGICPVVGDLRTPALSLVHARDLVDGMIAAALSSKTVGETYFLGSARAYAWGDVKDAATAALNRRALAVAVPPRWVNAIGALVEGVAKLTGKYPPLNREKAREIKDACKICSVEKAARDFGYRPSVSLHDGVAETIRWYRAAGWM